MGLLLLTAGGAAAQPILNEDGGFESFEPGAPANTLAWFFQVSDPADATLTIVEEPVHEGQRALRVDVAGTAGANLQASNQNIDVSGSGPGTYRYAGWARASEAGARLQVIGDHHGGSFAWFGNQTFELTTEWTEVTFEFEVPAESGGEAVERIRATHVLKFAENVGRTIYLDDVRVWKVETGGEPGEFAHGFESLDDLNSWVNTGSDPGLTLSLSDDAVEGEHSLEFDYDFVADQSWGGSVDIQYLAPGGLFADLSGSDGLRLAYKVLTPISNETDVNFAIKLVDVSTGVAELWEYRTTAVITDASGEWQQLEVPFGSFVLPGWVDQGDGELNLDAIERWEMQVVVGEPGVGNTYAGTFLLDDLILYSEAPAVQMVDQWGFNNSGQGWSLTTGEPGDVTVAGNAPPTGWMALRGEFEDVEPQLGESLVITGELELLGGGLTPGTTTNYPALRYGVYQDSTRAGELVDSTWSGEAGGHYGYLFTAPSGTGGGPTWQGSGEVGTFGGIRDRTWYSTNGPRDYVLGNVLHRPEDAEATAGTYDFAFSFTPLASGNMEVRFYLVKQDNSYYWAGSAVDDSLQVTTFNSVNFALSTDISATGMALRDVTVSLQDEAIDFPEPPVPVGETLNPNGSFAEAELGANTAPGWAFQTSSGGEAIYTIVDEAQDADGLALQIDIENLGTTSDDWNVEAVNEPIMDVQEGATYQYTVWLKADSDERVARIILGQPESGNWARPIQEDVELTTEWQRFAFLHTASASEASTGLRATINLNRPGNDTETTVYVDNLNFVKLAEGAFGLPEDVIDFWTFEDVAEADTSASGDIDYDGWTSGSEPDAGSVVLTTERAYVGSKSVRLTSTESSTEVRFQRHGPYPELSGDWVFQFRIWIASEDLQNVDNIRGYYLDADSGQPGPVSDTLFANEIVPNLWNLYQFRIPDGYAEPVSQIGLVLEATSAEAMPTLYVDMVMIREIPLVAVEPGDVPAQFVLEQNYPNPFHPTTTLAYELGAGSHVKLAVYNVLGQRVATLVDQPQTAGRHEVTFDAGRLAAGVYFYRLEAGDLVKTRQMLLVK